MLPFPASIVWSATSAALVGFAGSVAIVLEATRAVGASQAQSASWVIALSIGIAIVSVYLSVRHRMPIIAAWSTPGAALIASDGAGIGVHNAVGAFVFAGLLMLLSALIKPLGTLIERLPRNIAAAMLAGILLPFCLKIVGAVQMSPLLVTSLVLVFFFMQLRWATLAVPVVLVLGIGVAGMAGDMESSCCTISVAAPVLVMPSFDLQVAIGLAIPLFIVSMASQNLAGLAVLKADGYAPSARSCFATTGVVSLLTAPCGGHGVCLSSITAAICTGPHCHPDPNRRWMVAYPYAVCYLVVALFAQTLVEVLLALPSALVAAFVGLALLGPLSGALKVALDGDTPGTQAAVVTFVVAASGVSMLSLGAAPWSLVAGLAVVAVHRLTRRLQRH